MIANRFKTYVSLGNLGLFQKEVDFPFEIRILSCHGEQLKPFFPYETIMSLEEKEFKLPQGTILTFFLWGEIMSHEKKELKLFRKTSVFEILFNHNFCI